jgi:MoxR-like ATPase
MVSKLVIGKEEALLRLMLAAVLAEGHILLDDLPGVGKTTW